MKRSGPPKRKTRLRPVGKKRQAERSAAALTDRMIFDGVHAAVDRALGTVHSTTVRAPWEPQIKEGRLDCKPLREFHKRQVCSGCSAMARDPHHFPTLGAGGDDFGIIPACGDCHDRMQRYEVPFTKEWQEEHALRALLHFLRNAASHERAAFFAAWTAYAERRLFDDIPF